jgi:hypothetical protein
LQSHEFGDVLQVLAENVAIAFRYDRHVAHPELEQLGAASGVIQHVNGDEIDVFARKKLFRPQAAASPGLREQDELLGRDVHRGPTQWDGTSRLHGVNCTRKAAANARCGVSSML